MAAVLLAMSSFAQAGTIDPTFNPLDQGGGYGEGANDAIHCAHSLPDGKTLIGGDFITVNGQAHSYLARLNADGTNDPTFASGVYGGPVYAIAPQSDGKLVVGGWFSSVSGVPRNKIARLNTDGSLDASFDPGTGATNGIVYSVALQPDGKVLISGIFTTVNGTSRLCIARLNTNGSLDTSFDPGTGTNGNLVDNVAVQADGKILISGQFSFYNGTARKSIARLNGDGSLDNTFNPGVGPNGAIYAMAIQTDGKVVIGGTFQTYSGTSRRGLARVNVDGTLDPTFNPGTGVGTSAQEIRALAIAADGKVIAGGTFTSFNGSARNSLVRVNGDGSLDATFNPGAGASGTVNTLLLQPDGKTVIAGDFVDYGGAFVNRYTRVDANANRDTAFAPGSGVNGGLVDMTVLQPDGKLLLVGMFRRVNNVARERIARLNADGSLDPSFDPGGGANDGVFALVLQPDGKVLIGGTFTSINGIARNRIARLNADGTLDTSFDPGTGASAGVFDMVLQPDGKLILCGDFETVNGVSRYRIARLNTNGSVDTSFDPAFNAAVGGSLSKLALQPDGKLLFAGGFPSGTIKRLLASGALDNTFSTGSGNSFIGAIALQPDGKVLVGGDFNMFNNQPRAGLVRLSSTGALDLAFPGTNSLVMAILVQPNGTVLAAGQGLYSISTTNGLGYLGNPSPGPYYAMSLLPDGRVILAGDIPSWGSTGRNRVTRVLGGTDSTVQIDLTVHLGGPYASSTQLMADPLRASGLIPIAEPYSALGYVHRGSAGQTLAPSVLSINGNNAIVDWVMVELRHFANSVVVSQCALVQRDGDIVGLDGSTPLTLPAAAGAYYVAVRHRNHLGVMTAIPMALSATITTIDFTNPATPTYGTNAQQNVNSNMTLWPGDGNGNGTIQYSGADNDRDQVLQAIGGSVPTNVVSNVYDARDVNLDGAIMYVGANNDRDLILQTIGGTVPTATRTQQLP